MFTVSVFDSYLGFASAIFCTLIVSIAFLTMSFLYTRKRANQHYAENRFPAPSIPSFGSISKFMFVSSMMVTLLGFWFDSTFFLTLYNNEIVQVAGSLCVLVGFINLKLAFNHLGHHYSPSFDAYIPEELVTYGYYRFIRHPIYLFNLFVSFGLAMASGSAIVMANALIGLMFILKIIRIEEASLFQHFSTYQAYAKKTRRLLPFCY